MNYRVRRNLDYQKFLDNIFIRAAFLLDTTPIVLSALAFRSILPFQRYDYPSIVVYLLCGVVFLLFYFIQQSNKKWALTNPDGYDNDDDYNRAVGIVGGKINKIETGMWITTLVIYIILIFK